jgi:pathogenesis-related protein 1
MNVKSLSISLFLSMIFLGEAYALDGEQQSEMVKVHNQYRAEVGISSNVTWSVKLGEMAQAYANKLKDERGCNPIHSQADDVGENLYWASAIKYSSGITEVQRITAQRVADAWGSEKSDYSYSSNSCASGKICGHYTQMVWENTSQIGCAQAVCADNSQIWVCNYYPAGNYVGQKPY